MSPPSNREKGDRPPVRGSVPEPTTTTLLTRWFTIVVVTGVTVACYWLTFQPGRPFGPIPTLVWLSNFLGALGSLALGSEIARLFGREDRPTIGLAQLCSVAFFATLGILAGYAADPDWWDFGVLRVYYASPFIFGIPVIASSHLAGILKTRLFSDG